MQSDGPRALLPAPRTAARLFFGAPLRKQTYLNLAYLALAFPLGIVYFVFLTTGVSVSLALSILIVGIPLFVGVLAVTSLLATFERLLAGKLLGVDVRVARPASTGADGDGESASTRSFASRAWAYVVSLVTDAGTWKALVYLASKFVLGLVAFVAFVTALSTGGALLLTPLYYDYANVSVGFHLGEPTTVTPGLKLLFDQYLVGYSFSVQLTSWEVTSLPEALLASGLGVLVLLLSLSVFNAMAWAYGKYAELMLSSTPLLQRVRDAVDA